MNFRTVYKIYNVLLYGGILMMIAGVFASQLDFGTDTVATLEGLGFTIAVGGIIFGKLKYKCPYCKSRLNLREENPEYCPKCGKKLKDI